MPSNNYRFMPRKLFKARRGLTLADLGAIPESVEWVGDVLPSDLSLR